LIPFFKYIKPLWYFNLVPKNGNITYWYEAPKNLEHLVDKNVSYRSSQVLKMDLAYQLWSAGYIACSIDEKLNYNETKITVKDNYTLLARFVKKQWLFIVCFFRLLELKNPFLEIMGLFNALTIQKVKDKPLKDFLKAQQEENWNTFDSALIQENPLISVIIPTLNRYQYLKDVFRDLQNQTYKNFEVLVIDQTDAFDTKIYEGWSFDLKVWKQDEKALWLARNTAIQATKGEFILFSEDDIRFDNDFIQNHLKCLDYFNSDVSNGVFFPEHKTIPESRNYFKFSEQFATGNAMTKRSIFNHLGLFDRQFEGQRMGDGEFGLRLYLSGYKCISNPKAYCKDIKAPDGGLRQMGSWDAWRPKGLFAPRPVPSVLYLSRKYFGLKTSIWEILLNVPSTFVPYMYKSNNKMKILYIPVLVLLLPVLLITVAKSWYLASKKIKKGSLIGCFETN
jgi:glycosyltransferase involved in cell wall biosynthesis